MGLPFPKLKVAGSTPVSRSITSTRGLSGMWKEDRRRPDSPASDSDRLPIPDLDVPDGVTSLGRTLVVKGELTAGEHLIIEGQFEGHLAVPEHGLAVGKHAAVSADILAKTVTVLGRAKGTFTASDKMEIRASGFVEGRIAATRVAIDEGAYFKGSIDPTRTEAALAVGRHRLKQRAGAASEPDPVAS